MDTTVTFKLCRTGDGKNDLFVAGQHITILGAFDWVMLQNLLFETPECYPIYALGKDIGEYESKTVMIRIWEESDGEGNWFDFEEII